ncbi:hypothetical protein IBE11_03770 [Francisella tularensis subsp. novicida]|uniref:hypothetical protein n=1 Tax=Francisella tularensis TaxID=263 RepID=UPI000B06733E|nr:hypothetical protein [Francisella tularensis]MBK2344839.1 hypothetical protein [Francisella tularensis subsp. novicida]MBK2349591.1 hypothetical protein [Francisella tularensis subsp. novicida]MBK2354946.1 hypothetical protein [Francisella tularensis subsp. novicida]MBK2358564.1 hypothetical protein [Francisella tularensis subsp. novicida]
MNDFGWGCININKEVIVTDDYYSNKFIVFILSTFDVFSFEEYKYEYNLLKQTISDSEIPENLLYEFLECLFSMSLNKAYLEYQDVMSANSFLTPYQHAKLIGFFYDDFIKELKKTKKFIKWYEKNADRFEISQICNYKPTIFKPTDFELTFIENATVGLKKDKTTTVAKLYKTFLQTQNCKKYGEYWLKLTEPNLPKIFDDYKFDTSLFKSHIRGGKYVLKLPEVSNFDINDNLTIKNIFDVLFSLWQVYSSIKKCFYEIDLNLKMKYLYGIVVGRDRESSVSMKLAEIYGCMTQALNYLKDFYDSPFTSNFDYLINEVKYTDNPMGDTDSISKISERSSGADPFIKAHYKSVFFDDYEISITKNYYSKKTKESDLYKLYLSKYSHDIKSPYPEFFYDENDRYYDEKNKDALIYDPKIIEKKLIRFWIKEHGLYMLYVFILSKVFGLSIPENPQIYDKLKFSKKKKVFERDIDMRFNFNYLSQLSHVCNLYEES